MNKLVGAIAVLMLILGCSKQAPERTEATAAPQVSRPPQSRAAPKSSPAPAVDPTSTAAARDLVQTFADRLQARQFDQAYALISRVLPTWQESEFTGDYSARREIRAAVGEPAAPEGAAGSLYVTVPLFVTGRSGDGRPFRESWTLTLRRVNDVPGSTAEQRRWHIEQIDRRRSS